MAIYYIDQYASTGGTGTWADPWTTTNNTRTGLADGDEIRLKGVALTDLLTTTAYTATLTDSYSIEINSGGSLGADFAPGDVIYYEDFDTFAPINSVSGNKLQLYSSGVSMHPINDLSVTSLNIRKVDTSTYGYNGSSWIYFPPLLQVSNLTISDCWIDVAGTPTRITDGTVKSLFHTGTVTASLNIYMSSNASNIVTESITYNFQNTHFLSGRSSQSTYLYCNMQNSILNLRQVYSSYAYNGGINGGNTLYASSYNTFNIDYTTIIGQNYSGIDCTFNISNLHANSSYYMCRYLPAGAKCNGSTYNIGNIILKRISGSLIDIPGVVSKSDFNLNGYVDLMDDTGILVYSTDSLINTAGPATFTFGPLFTIYFDRRSSTKIAMPGALAKVSFSGASAGTGIIHVPTIINNSSLTTGWDAYVQSYIDANTCNSPYKKTARTIELSLPTSLNNIYSNMHTANINLLVTSRDNTLSPYEFLGIGYFYSGFTQASSIYFPKLTLDNSVVHSSGPSFKTDVTSYQYSYWNPSYTSRTNKSIKNIKIPCIAGQSYTVSGYVRNNMSTFANGDMRMSIVLDDTEVVFQDMTTACYNAWEQFTLTFTAAATGEYLLTWEMHFPSNGSMYLDDITIS